MSNEKSIRAFCKLDFCTFTEYVLNFYQQLRLEKIINVLVNTKKIRCSTNST